MVERSTLELRCSALTLTLSLAELTLTLTLTPTLALTLTLTQVQRPLAAGAQGAVRGQRSAQRCGAVPEWW